MPLLRMANKPSDQEQFMQLAHLYKCASAAQESYLKPHDRVIRATINEVMRDVRNQAVILCDTFESIDPNDSITEIARAALSEMRKIIKMQETMHIDFPASGAECVRVIQDLNNFLRIEEEDEEGYYGRELVVYLDPKKMLSNSNKEQIYDELYELLLFNFQKWIRVDTNRSPELKQDIKAGLLKVARKHEIKRENEIENPDFTRRFAPIDYSLLALDANTESRERAEERLTESIQNLLVMNLFPTLYQSHTNPGIDYEELYAEIEFFLDSLESGRNYFPGYRPDNFQDHYLCNARELYSPSPHDIGFNPAKQFAVRHQGNISQLLAIKRKLKSRCISHNYKTIKQAFRPYDSSLLYFVTDERFSCQMEEFISITMNQSYITVANSLNLTNARGFFERNIMRHANFVVDRNLLDHMTKRSVLLDREADSGERRIFVNRLYSLIFGDNKSIHPDISHYRSSVMGILFDIEKNVGNGKIVFNMQKSTPKDFANIFERALDNGSICINYEADRASDVQELIRICKIKKDSKTTAETTYERMQDHIN